MSLRKKQSEFAYKVALLILYAHGLGYEVTFGEAFAYPEDNRHVKNSFHYRRLAIDLNLFIKGIYQTTTEAHRPLGEFWESIGGTWGGRFGDGNHYSWGE